MGKSNSKSIQSSPSLSSISSVTSIPRLLKTHRQNKSSSSSALTYFSSSSSTQLSLNSPNSLNSHLEIMSQYPSSLNENLLNSDDFDICQYIGDRKYCKSGIEDVNYVYPVDDDEVDRCQMQHFLMKHIWEGNFSAPVEELLSSYDTKILDIGCGSGAWILEMATEYPRPQFVGIDIVPLYPSEIHPTNVKFRQANVLTGLPFEDETFDFVYMRFMTFAFTINDWERAIKEALRVTKKGGYVEIMETDFRWYNEGPFDKTSIGKFLQTQNMDLIASPLITKYLNKFSNSEIKHEERKIAIGEWGGKLGKLYRELYGWASRNLRKVITDSGINDTNWDHTVEICLKQLNELRAYDEIHRFWIVKSLETEEE
ncbi:S-adenosyl-L-methionine-dependent methyltransferase [Gigaspora margarita]|uniref:S-adenosyl-L-methionine-dependent methyltransferase n=1 Tax=Gigaspora margarita TaxID=4874 RepID=A0A8H4B389_GIGMA|nr:S-adenosyl-L-methionine-dependent methyltransferase [Gigaspora margarita]